jgi:hypothetical protein
MKPDYIKHLEQSAGIYSELHFPTLNYDLVRYFDEKKLKRVFESSGLGEKDKIFWYEVIYISNHPFYLHVTPIANDTSTLTIYYKPEQLNELIVFIRIILKQIDNAANNNNRTETKN